MKALFGTILRDATGTSPYGDEEMADMIVQGHADALRVGPILDFVMVGHGVTNRQFRHRWMHYPWQWVEAEPNPGNCSIQVIRGTASSGYEDVSVFDGFRHVRGHEKQELREDGHVLPDTESDEDAVQKELEAYCLGAVISPALRTRLIAESEPERLNDDMREGRSDALLHLAWLRS